MKRYYTQIGLFLSVVVVVLMVGFGGYYLYQYVMIDNPVIDEVLKEDPNLNPESPDVDEGVSGEIKDIPVVAMEKFMRPFAVDAKVVKPYFDVYKDLALQVSAVTYFEGVYRPNLGVDYAYENNAFNVTASASGVVSEVYDDQIFGKTVVITSANGYVITYQSLSDVAVKANNTIKQGDLIGVATENMYNPELKKHVHVSVEKNGVFMNLEEIVSLVVK